MTDEQIDAMEAGREMDALVAEKVMGWIWWKPSQSGNRSIHAPSKPPGWLWELANGSEPLSVDWKAPLPCYSTDIAAAWQVVEKLRELNLIGHFREALDFAPIWGWLDFSPSDLSFLICRAALKCCKESLTVRKEA